jgi:hypothetical protein
MLTANTYTHRKFEAKYAAVMRQTTPAAQGHKQCSLVRTQIGMGVWRSWFVVFFNGNMPIPPNRVLQTVCALKCATMRFDMQQVSVSAVQLRSCMNKEGQENKEIKT